MELRIWNSVYKTWHRTTTRSHNTSWPLAQSFHWNFQRTKLWYFIILNRCFSQQHVPRVMLDCKVRLKVCHPLLTVGIEGWTLETTCAIGLFPLLLGALTTPLHAHLQQMTLCCGSLEQNRGHGWLVLALPRSLLPPLMTSKTPTLQKYFHLNKPLILSLGGESTPLCFRTL